MSVMSLELLKKHVRADEFATDDEYLQYLLDTAEEYVATATNRTTEELKALGDGTQYPLMLQHAVLLIAGHWYNQRESVSAVQMYEAPDALQALVKPFRKLVDDIITTTV